MLLGEDVLTTDFYLTQAEHDKAPPPPGPRSSCLHFGRPKFCHDIFPSMKALAQEMGESRVAVLTCGPHGMVADVERSCVEHSGDGILFELHSETFSF